MKIALVTLYGTNSMGSRHLHSVLTRKGHDVHFVFFKEASFDHFSSPAPSEYAMLDKLLKELQAPIIAISIGAFMFAEIAEKISVDIKKWFTGHLLWGGVYPTLLPERCVKFADLVCIGDGEEAFPEMVSHIENSKPLTHIKNLCFLNEKGEVVKNSVRDIKRELEYCPDLSGKNKYYIEKNRISYMEPLLDNKFQYMTQVSCGCPFSCSFCSETTFKKLYGNKSTLRVRSVENIISELIDVKKRIPDTCIISFGNEVFPSDEKWVNEFEREYKRHIDLPFFCFMNPTFLNRQLLFSLKKAGLAIMELGVQSGSKRIHKTIFNRPEDLEEVITGIKECHALGIKPTLDFIVDNPYDTLEDKIDTLNFVSSIKKPFDIKLYSFTYLPGTRLTDKALDEGLICPSYLENSFKIPHETGLGWANLAKKRSPDELVYICLLSLSSKQILSKNLVMYLINSKISTRFPLLQCLKLLAVSASCLHVVLKWGKYSRKRSFLKHFKKAPFYFRYITRQIS